MEKQRHESLNLELLGDFRAVYGGNLVAELDAPRLQRLLAYVALHPGTPQSRQHTAFTFWPDSTEKQALTNLRQLLHHLRHALPGADRFLEADAKTLLWKSDAPYSLDVEAFQQALGQADLFERQAAPDAVGRALEEAVRHYTGDLLPSCYDEWIAPERERLREHYVAALDRLISWLEERRRYPEAIRYARLLLRQDPLRETAYRSLMRLHAVRRDRASALRVYHECTTALERELGVAPAPATREVYDRLLNVEASPASEPDAHAPSFAAEVPLVGRQPEWKQLRAAWRTARGGQAHFVYILGEAGVGKTRLAEELLMWAARQGTLTARARCYAAEGRLAFAPVAAWLRSSTILKAANGLDAVWRSEVARILPELLTEDPDLTPPEPLAESWQRQRLFEALARCFLAARQPMVLLIDDLQWCDRETLEWMHYLLRFDTNAQLLVVGTARAEELVPEHALKDLLLELQANGQMTELMLAPLNVAQTTALAEHASSRALSVEHASYLYEETEGNPLFVVESVRAQLAEPGRRPARSAAGTPPTTASLERLPPRVRAILSARMAQLTPGARELAHLAATIGRDFTFEVLAEAGDYDEDALVRNLDELWQRRIVREYGASAYDFSHDKLREVAYAEVRPAGRRLLHRRVAAALEALYDGELDAFSAAIATHYEQTGLADRAIPYYQRAAEVAQRIHANEEAIEHLNRALALLKTLKAGPQRDEHEIALRVRLGPSLIALKGPSAPEVGRLYEETRALCGPQSDPAQLLQVVWGLRSYYNFRAELEAARSLGEEFLHMAQLHDDPNMVASAHLDLACSFFHLGQLIPAREHLLARPSSPGPGSHTFAQGLDLGAFGLSYESHVLWHLGQPDEALARSQEALARAEELAHPFTRAIALDYAAMLRQFRREVEPAREHAEAAVALCEEYRFTYYRGWGTIIQGWAWAEQGRPVAGRAVMQQGLDALSALGARLRRPYCLALLAETVGKAGGIEEGLAILDDALTLVHTCGNRWYEPELHRLKGELRREQDASEAERCFRTAHELALHQHTRPLALRAAMSLHRLRRHDAGSDDSRALLKQAFDVFTEGFDTADLKEARALLEETS